VSATDKAYKNARQLRRRLSLPEVLLWRRLKGGEPKFRRQHPLGPYVLDFYCAGARLAIEVDGIAHDMGDRPRREGVDVLRIAAKEVLADPDGVADGLLRLCDERCRPLHHPALPDGPPPHAFGAGRSE
jgi:very-short-patch-repair endonuclease